MNVSDLHLMKITSLVERRDIVQILPPHNTGRRAETIFEVDVPIFNMQRASFTNVSLRIHFKNSNILNLITSTINNFMF